MQHRMVTRLDVHKATISVAVAQGGVDPGAVELVIQNLGLII